MSAGTSHSCLCRLAMEASPPSTVRNRSSRLTLHTKSFRDIPAPVTATWRRFRWNVKINRQCTIHLIRSLSRILFAHLKVKAGLQQLVHSSRRKAAIGQKKGGECLVGPQILSNGQIWGRGVKTANMNQSKGSTDS